MFSFFSEASNLEKITPPWLHFRILSQSTPKIEKGTLIDYRLRLHGIPIKWRTLIADWNPTHDFVDTQLKGPYKLWHHTHIFEAQNGGVLMTDRVKYQVPLGTLGRWAAGNFVKKDIEEIFRYRKEIITKFFGA